MNVKWLIEKDVFEEEESYKQAIPTERLILTEYRPLGDYNQYQDTDCVLAVGSCNFIKQVHHGKAWTPGVFYDPNMFKCSMYYTYWGKYLLNQKYMFITFAELIRNAEIYYKMFNTDKLFIRPDMNDKCFTGSVVSLLGLRNWKSKVESFIKPETLLVVAEPRKIHAEYRFVVIENKIITSSSYIINNEVKCFECSNSDIIFYAEQIAKDQWQPDRAYVLDIGVLDDSFALLEIGSISSAGLYACDVHKIVAGLEKLATILWTDVN